MPVAVGRQTAVAGLRPRGDRVVAMPIPRNDAAIFVGYVEGSMWSSVTAGTDQASADPGPPNLLTKMFVKVVEVV